MTWFPNELGIQRFADLIWPRIKAAVPETVIHVIGAHPPDELRRRGERDANFRVLGYVDDIRPYVGRAAVYVVPIHVGGGTRVKILDAMAMAKAIVSHPVGAEGLEVAHGHDLLIAEAPGEFADAVVSLIRNSELRKRLGRNARQTVESKYSWPKIVPALEDIYSKAASESAGAAVEV
jgi:glycosyltransferase involved in cell wall biosynthesis